MWAWGKQVHRMWCNALHCFIRPVKSWVLVCWWWWFDWSFARFISSRHSINLWFYKHRLTQVHFENGRLNGQRDTREVPRGATGAIGVSNLGSTNLKISLTQNQALTWSKPRFFGLKIELSVLKCMNLANYCLSRVSPEKPGLTWSETHVLRLEMLSWRTRLIVRESYIVNAIY